MTVDEIRQRIKASLWQAIAQSEIDLSSLSESDQTKLVELVTDTALIEMDESIDSSTAVDKEARDRYYPTESDVEEVVLWEGRPFLSLSEHYVITSERLRVVRGLLGKSREDIELIRVQDIDQKQTLRERMLNLGDIMVNSHDSSNPRIVLNNIREPEKVHNILRQAVREIRLKHKLTFQEEM